MDRRPADAGSGGLREPEKSPADSVCVQLLQRNFPSACLPDASWSVFGADEQPDIIISLTQGRVICLPAPALLGWINIICDSEPLSPPEQAYLSCRRRPGAFEPDFSRPWTLAPVMETFQQPAVAFSISSGNCCGLYLFKKGRFVS